MRPDVTQDSPSHEPLSRERESISGASKSRVRERRREGRSKTFDWAEFRPIAQALAQQRAQEAESFHADLGELEQSRRREERCKTYESVTVPSAQDALAKDRGMTDHRSGVEANAQTPDSIGPTEFERQKRMEEVIEQHWQQVETTPIREERRVPLSSSALFKETAELEHLLENYRRGVLLPFMLFHASYQTNFHHSWQKYPCSKIQNNHSSLQLLMITINDNASILSIYLTSL